ncbi:hypothetical protein [Streptomyces sp. WZ-12]|uniref:hypothetical protein n=1 Tax=Streptomyces sp. WZ-12 TaxID=3030210 RepID=UPI002381879A|nr:hypothetical protein [Streptomyces sp. WZ-12]
METWTLEGGGKINYRKFSSSGKEAGRTVDPTIDFNKPLQKEYGFNRYHVDREGSE